MLVPLTLIENEEDFKFMMLQRHPKREKWLVWIKKNVQLQKVASKNEKKLDMIKKRQTSDFDNIIEIAYSDSSSSTIAENSNQKNEYLIDPSKP